MTSPAGTFVANCVVKVAASPDVAFEAWSSRELLTGWMGYRETGGDGTPRLIAVDDVEISPRVGAEFRMTMITLEQDGARRHWVHQGEVVEAKAPEKLGLTWISEGTRHEPTLLELWFTPTSEGETEVRLRHSGFTTEEIAKEHAEGWDVLLDLFSEVMISAVSAGLKLTAARLKAHLRARRGST